MEPKKQNNKAATKDDNIDHHQRKSLIYVTRKEHLWEDWDNINSILEGAVVNAIATGSSRKKLGSLKQSSLAERNISGWILPVARQLSYLARQKLCRALEAEYRHFITILESAENLSDLDVRESLDYSRRLCPDLAILGDYDTGSHSAGKSNTQ